LVNFESQIQFAMNTFSESEIQRLKEAVSLLEKYKFSDMFGDIAGSLQKVIDVMEISGSKEPGEAYDFISPEKEPHFRGSEYLVQLIEAIKSGKVLRLYYHPFYEDKPYFTEVHPYLLKEYRNRWYMIGLNDYKNQLRTYALDRIRDLQESETVYQDRPFSASEYFKHSIGIISPPGDAPKIKIAVQKTQAQYIISQPWHETQNIEGEDEDEVIFSYKIHPTYELVSLLLSIGKDLRVIEPQSLRDRMKEEIEGMLGRY
jgi:predicted DNA-binding transcriptional regulator YafY